LSLSPFDPMMVESPLVFVALSLDQVLIFLRNSVREPICRSLLVGFAALCALSYGAKIDDGSHENGSLPVQKRAFEFNDRVIECW
jgi:hypothetical protein